MVKIKGRSFGATSKGDEIFPVWNSDGTVVFYSHTLEHWLSTDGNCTKFHQKPSANPGNVFKLVSACTNKSIAVDGQLMEFLLADNEVEQSEEFIGYDESSYTLNEIVCKS